MHDVVVDADEYAALAQAAAEMCSEMDSLLARFTESLQRACDGMEGDAATAMAGLLSNIRPLCSAASTTAEQNGAALERFAGRVGELGS